MWDHYSKRACEAVGQATAEAMGMRQDWVAPGHLLLGLLRRGDNFALRVLAHMGVPAVALAEAVTPQLMSAPSTSARGLQFTAEAQGVLQAVYGEARLLNHNYVGTEHLLLALAGEAGTAGRVLREFGVTADRARQAVQSLQWGPAMPEQTVTGAVHPAV